MTGTLDRRMLLAKTYDWGPFAARRNPEPFIIPVRIFDGGFCSNRHDKDYGCEAKLVETTRKSKSRLYSFPEAVA